jgi:adenylate cyclase
MAEASETLQRRIEAPAPLVWALVADTNRFDRAAGLTAGTYRFREGPDGARERVATARQSGFTIEWVEPAYDWLEGRFVRGSRTFTAGPARAGGFSVEIQPAPDAPDRATLIEARAWVAGDGLLGLVARAITRPKFKAALRDYLDAIAELLGRAGVGYDPTEPPAAAARRALLLANTHPIASGARTPHDASNLEFRARRFAQAPVAPELRDRLIELLRSRPDEDLATIRPFEIAHAWGADRRDVLKAFLHATRAGLVELHWQINCPSCRVGASTATTLSAVERRAHCDACNIGYDLDFAEHIEAIFKISPSIRVVEAGLYCASSPWFRPHVFGQLTVAAGDTVTRRCALPPGTMLVRTQRHGRRGEVAARPARLSIALGPSGLELRGEGQVGPGEETELEVVNRTAAPEIVLFERTGWEADIVLGSVIATFPEFLDLFSTEAPASGVELTVSSLTVLFSDLTGSTALYERVGDARAFAIVEQHFRDMGRSIDRHGGAIVKTMGDAVMATFASPADALRASFEMIAACERAHGDEGLSVKLGLHEGACLAVRANDRLDFFGTTVNVAARLQAQARGSEVVLAESLLEHADVRALCEGRSLRAFEASLKGIRDAQRLLGVSSMEPR